MLLLNELASLRAKARSNELHRSDILEFAESISSCDDIDTLIELASGRFADGRYVSEATTAAYFEGGLNNFGNQERSILQRDNALELLLSVSATMKQCVLDCNDHSAWKFLCEAAELETRSGPNFSESSESLRALEKTLSPERLRALANGTTSVPDHLIRRWVRATEKPEQARILWQLKQYADEVEVRKLYHRMITRDATFRWLSIQSLLFFSDARDIEYLWGMADVTIDDPGSGSGRVGVSPESVANVVAACATKIGSSKAMPRLLSIRGIAKERLTALVDWLDAGSSIA